jgi:hypothetical protein
MLLILFSCQAANGSSARVPMYSQPGAGGWLATKSELLGERGVARCIFTLEECQQSTSLTDELQEPAARVVVLLKGLQVRGQSLNALREECDLNVCGPSVSTVTPVVGNDACGGFLV